MAQNLSSISQESRMKAAYVLARAFEFCSPGLWRLTEVVAQLAPDTDTRGVAILALDAVIQERGFESWGYFEQSLLKNDHLAPPANFGFAAIKLLTRPAD